MTPELSSSSTLPALPVRRREILEILDTALKLYRRYFWVLIGWSALVSSLALIPFLQWFAIFASPLLFGAVSCCVAAAVRGQSVKFSQCWAFTKPRYGPLLGTLLLSYLVLFGIFIAICIAGILVGLLGAWALSSAPQPLQIVGAIVGIILALIGFSVLGMGAFGWMSMVPIVVCLEDDKRSTAAMGRAFDLLKGNWRRVFGLSLILGLAVLAVFIIVGVIYALIGIGGAGDLFGSNPSQSAILGAFASIAGFMGVFFMIWNPVQTLVIAVLYLDLRVRREALDLEWTAYASAPPAPANLEFAPLGGGVSGSALRVGSSFGEGASTLETPASFGAGRVEVATPIEAPSPVQDSGFQAVERPLISTFSSTSEVLPLSVDNPVNGGSLESNITVSQSDVTLRNSLVSPAENVIKNNFEASTEIPLTNPYLPVSIPTPSNEFQTLTDTATPTPGDNFPPFVAEMPPLPADSGGENEARRD